MRKAFIILLNCIIFSVGGMCSFGGFASEKCSELSRFNGSYQNDDGKKFDLDFSNSKISIDSQTYSLFSCWSLAALTTPMIGSVSFIATLPPSLGGAIEYSITFMGDKNNQLTSLNYSFFSLDVKDTVGSGKFVSFPSQLSRNDIFIPPTSQSNSTQNLTATDGGYESPATNAKAKPSNGTFNYSDGEIFEGDLSNGIPDGYGKVTFPNGNIYVGEVLNGTLSGRGTMTFKNGEIFQGNFTNGLKEGKGEVTYPNGSKFQGEFVNDDAIRGLMTYSNGDIYEGTFLKGLRHGKGILTNKNGYVYEGDFSNDVASGKASIQYTDGVKYTGDVINGLRNGVGELKYHDGGSFSGEFANNVAIQGLMTYTNGAKYNGSFKNGLREGKGRYVAQDGSSYEGDFVNDVATGKGLMRFTDGSKYEGYIDNWKMNGSGVLIFPNQNRNIGIFDNNKFVFGKAIDANGVFIAEIYNGKWKTVQNEPPPNYDQYWNQFWNTLEIIERSRSKAYQGMSDALKGH